VFVGDRAPELAEQGLIRPRFLSDRFLPTFLATYALKP